MTVGLILKIITYVVVAGVPAFFLIRAMVKQKATHKKEIAMHRETEKALIGKIAEMIRLKGEKEDVEIQVKTIVKNINELTDSELDSNYDKQLSNMPGKRDRTGD